MIQSSILIQKNINEFDFEKIVVACKKLNINLDCFYHIPFSNEYPILRDELKFVYAASSVTDQIYTDYKEFKGVFNHTNYLQLDKYPKKSLWNSDAKIIDFVKLEKLEPNTYFVRPLDDSKLFAGMIFSSTDLKEFVQNCKKNNIEEYLQSKVCVSLSNTPEYEIRYFIVDTQIITSSLYAKYGQKTNEIFQTKEFDSFIYDFIKNTQLRFKLPKAFVLDLGLSKNKCGVIELNTINNSGFYNSNIEELLETLTSR